MDRTHKDGRPKDPVAQLRGRAGGLTRAARTVDRNSLTSAARDARWQRYLDQVPAEITDEQERIRRADQLRRADLAKMSLAAAVARKRAAAARRAAAEADSERDALERIAPPESAA